MMFSEMDVVQKGGEIYVRVVPGGVAAVYPCSANLSPGKAAA